MKILVMKFRHIGDVLLTTPLLSNLKHYYPDATIDFALNKGCEAMIEGNPNIRKIHIYDRDKIKNSKIFKHIKLEFEFAKAIKDEKYDLFIQTTEGDRGIFIAKFAKTKRIISFESKSYIMNKFITDKLSTNLDKMHIVDINLLPLKVLNLEPIHKKVEISTAKELDFELPPKFIHMHITSRWMFKCVDNANMAEILDFANSKLPVVLTADKVKEELEKVKVVLALAKSKPINLAGKLSLKEVNTISKKASIYIGVDTAIMHMAAANNTHCIALFGPSLAYIWGPWDNDLMQSGYKKPCGIQKMGKHTLIQKEMSPDIYASKAKFRANKELLKFDNEWMSKIKDIIQETINSVFGSDTKLVLTEFIGGDSKRYTYVHPFDKNRCVKVLIDKEAEDFNMKDSEIYDFLGEIMGDFVPKHESGFVDTNMGKGIVSELIRDENGEISQNLTNYLKNNKFDLHEELDKFVTLLIKNDLYFYDFNLNNFLVQKTASGKKLRFIDLKSFKNSRSALNLERSDFFAKKKLRRRVKKLYEILGITLPDFI
ncbi:MAG: putative lipopolysaccharide heptosyltransferase III [Campylobacter sp.]|nr:putative lipopolysaccharide heptosyltransferase III [Campylobacter sp.]